jgi:REP element-mobilizing transposase RayT
MGRPVRRQKKKAIYFITNRTLQQRYFFRPGLAVNEIILGLLAKTADRYGIEIFSFVFMSNHFHLLARSRSLQMHLFMKDFQSQLARKLNVYWGRTGPFVERRYTATEVLDDDQLTDKLRYTVCNPCESDLVRHPKLWPGLSSWTIHKTGLPMMGEVVNRDLYWSLKRKKGNEDLSEQELIDQATEYYPLALAKLPKFAALEDAEYHDKMRKLIEEYAGELAKTRTRPCVGVKKVLSQSFYDRPKNSKKSPRPICHTNCPKKRKAYLEELWEVTERYQDAVAKLREQKTQISFPQGTIPPGHLYAVG